MHAIIIRLDICFFKSVLTVRTEILHFYHIFEYIFRDTTESSHYSRLRMTVSEINIFRFSPLGVLNRLLSIDRIRAAKQVSKTIKNITPES